MQLKTLGKAKTALVVVYEGKYNSAILDVAKQAAKEKVIYITMNKTYGSLKEQFTKKRINLNNIKFIDVITKHIKDVKNTKDCTYVSCPEALTELSIIISKHLEYPFDYLILDSITNLLIYADVSTVKNFVKDLTVKIGESGCKGVIFAVPLKEHMELIRIIKTFVDKTTTI